MPLHMKRQMIRPAERSLAQVAAEGFLARVLPVVPRQFVGSGELPCASVPRALVRLFSCKKRWNFVIWHSIWNDRMRSRYWLLDKVWRSLEDVRLNAALVRRKILWLFLEHKIYNDYSVRWWKEEQIK